MRNILIAMTFFLFAVFLFSPQTVFAHQPRIISGTNVTVENPEVSQAFYGELQGTPVDFQIKSSQEFKLYVGLLVPDIIGVRKDISAEIYRIKDGKKETLATLEGAKFKWTPFYEEFAKDNYFWGPEFAASDSVKGKELKGRLVPAGDYHIRVFSQSNRGKYVIVFGFLESFPPNEMFNSLLIIPQTKFNFFNESLPTVFSSPFVWGPIIFIITITIILICLFKRITVKKQKISKRN